MTTTVAGYESLFTALRTEGIAVGFEEVESVAAVFEQQVPAGLDDRELRTVLRAILAKDLDQRERFDRVFDEWYSQNEANFGKQQKDGPLRIDVPEPPPPPPPSKAARTVQREWIWAGLVAATLTLLLAWLAWPQEPASPKQTDPPPPQEDPPATRPDPGPSATDDDLPSEPASSYSTWVPVDVRITPLPAPWTPTILYLAAAAAAAASILAIRHWQLLRREIPQIGAPKPGPQWLPAEALPAEAEPLLSPADRRVVTYGVSRFLSEEPTTRVDLERTVASTAARAGLVTVELEQETHTREVWIWEDERTDAPTRATVAAELARLLARANLPVRRGTFYGVPDEVEWESGDRFSPLTLEGHRQQAIVVILTDGTGLIQAERSGTRGPVVRALLSSFRGWSRLALVHFGTEATGLPALAVRWGLRWMSERDAARFVGGERREPRLARAERRLVGSHRVWAAALALSPEGFTQADALALLRRLELPLDPWEWSTLAARAKRWRRQLRFDESERLSLLQFLSESEVEPKRLHPTTPLAVASHYWMERLEMDARTRASAERPNTPWVGTAAERRRRMEIALLQLWREPQPAAAALMALAGSGLQDDIRDRIALLYPADTPDDPSSGARVLRLPWEFHAQPQRTQWELWRLGFAAGSVNASPAPEFSVEAKLAMGFGAGALLVMLMLAGRSRFEWSQEDSRFASEPTNRELTQRVAFTPSNDLEDPRLGRSATAVFGPRENWDQRTLPGATGYALEIVWLNRSRDAQPLRIDGLSGVAEIWNYGSPKKRSIRHPEGWPLRSVAAIALPPSNRGARQLALALLDSGSADRVLLSRSWPSEMKQLTQITPGEVASQNLQLLVFCESARLQTDQLDSWDMSGTGLAGAYPLRAAVEISEDPSIVARRLRSLPSSPQPIELLATPLRTSDVFYKGTKAGVRVMGCAPGPDVLDMLPVPKGTFLMGSAEDDKEGYENERPLHEVSIRPFSMARTEVTRGQWRRLGLPEPSEWKSENSRDSDDLLPANYVSWSEARRFCNLLSKREKLQPYYEEMPDGTAGEIRGGVGYRLPTEAEWEYACRAGTKGPYSFEGGEAAFGVHGWYFRNSGDKELDLSVEWDSNKYGEWNLRPRAVGTKSANPLGLHDMHGNLWEWCEDHWLAGYEGAPKDGSARLESASESRVIRGGSFRSPARSARSAFRGIWSASSRYDYVGFRPARSGS